jgi:hypothetical protein
MLLGFFKNFAPHFVSAGRIEEVQSFDTIEAELGAKLPADYKAFLMWADGGETLPPIGRMTFYPLADLIPRRADGQPPGTLEFATDDSSGFAFDLTVNVAGASYPVVTYPLGERTRDMLEFVADKFNRFVEILLDPSARYR